MIYYKLCNNLYYTIGFFLSKINISYRLLLSSNYLVPLHRSASKTFIYFKVNFGLSMYICKYLCSQVRP